MYICTVETTPEGVIPPAMSRSDPPLLLLHVKDWCNCCIVLHVSSDES